MQPFNVGTTMITTKYSYSYYSFGTSSSSLFRVCNKVTKDEHFHGNLMLIMKNAWVFDVEKYEVNMIILRSTIPIG